MEIVSKREKRDPEQMKGEYMKVRGLENNQKRPTIRTAESNSMNTSHAGTAFAQ